MKENIIRIDIEKRINKNFKYSKYKENGMFILLLENGEDVDLSNYTAKVLFEKLGGDIFTINCNITNNVINVPLQDIVLEKNEKISFEIVLTGKRQRVTTFRMCLI